MYRVYVFRRMNRMKNAILSMLAAARTIYVCPMHPEVVSDVPGVCPKCNMKLDPMPGASETPDSL